MQGMGLLMPNTIAGVGFLTGFIRFMLPRGSLLNCTKREIINKNPIQFSNFEYYLKETNLHQLSKMRYGKEYR